MFFRNRNEDYSNYWRNPEPMQITTELPTLQYEYGQPRTEEQQQPKYSPVDTYSNYYSSSSYDPTNESQGQDTMRRNDYTNYWAQYGQNQQFRKRSDYG